MEYKLGVWIKDTFSPCTESHQLVAYCLLHLSHSSALPSFVYLSRVHQVHPTSFFWFLSPLMAYFLCPGVNHINWKSSVLHWILLKDYVYKLCSNLKQIRIQHWHAKTSRQLLERAKCSTVKGVTFERAHGSTGQSVGFRPASCVTSQVRDPF